MSDTPPFFSLIMATIGRTTEIDRFLSALEIQSFDNFELIIVDQNQDDRVVDLIRPFQEKFRIIHLRSAPGLSRARNMGLGHVRGSIIAFPDDDCWYPPQLLEKVHLYFLSNPAVAGLCGMCRDGQGRPAAARWAEQSAWITRKSIWRQAISFTIFVRLKEVIGLGGFDEELGVGAKTPWGSGEETDYLLRILSSGGVLYYDRELVVHHPMPVSQYDEKSLLRARNYGMGLGRVLRKHGYGFEGLLSHLIRPFAGMLLSFVTLKWPRASFYWNVLTGRAKGYFSSAK